MGQRNPKSGFSVQHVLRGRTLRGIVESGTTIKINCDHCSRSTVWSPAQALKEPKFDAFMGQPIEALAGQLRCAACQSRDFFVTILTARNPLL